MLQSRPVGFSFRHTLARSTKSLRRQCLGRTLALGDLAGAFNIRQGGVNHLLGIGVFIGFHRLRHSLGLISPSPAGQFLGLGNSWLGCGGGLAELRKSLLLLWREARHHFACISLIRAVRRSLGSTINIKRPLLELGINGLRGGCGLLSAAFTHGAISLETVVIIPLKPRSFKARTQPRRPVPVSLVQ